MIPTKMWMLYLTATILSVMQIHSAAGCTINSVTSSSASTMTIAWDAVSDVTSYQLVLKVINSTTIAAVTASVNAPTTTKRVYGLRPGHHYEITLTVFKYFTKMSTCNSTGMTVPDIVKITSATAVSSSSITFQWDRVIGAENYTVHVEQLFSSNKTSKTFSSLYGEVTQLDPSTTYNCYIIASNSAGYGAKGSTKTLTTLIPPPNDVNITTTGKSTATVTWTPRIGVIMYQVTVTDTDPSHNPVVYKTTDTSISIINLEPCSNYTVGVSSLDSFSDPGEPNELSYITSTIDPVTTFTYQYNCTTARVTVTWNTVFGANSYIATVTDGSGESLNCTSASTSCVITAVKCGEKYSIHVTTISDDCHSTSILIKTFDTVPCAPANPRIEYDCSSNGIIYKWLPTNNTLYYKALAINLNGNVQECRTRNNMCYYTNVGCGETYNFTVQAISTDCNSEVTVPDMTKIAPCLPQNIKTSTECTSDTLTTTWDAAAGAQSYIVKILGNNGNYNCTTQNTSCELEGVPCGEHLSVTVAASNEQCTTQDVLGEVAETAPCPPTIGSVSNDCSPDTATVNWSPSKGVVYYIVTAEDSKGIQYMCNSLDSECDMENLACGETFNVNVIGTNIRCNSSASASASFQTAPCPPSNVLVERNCTSNQDIIKWHDHQATGSYTAVIKDSQSGEQTNCTSSTVNFCSISSLPCGKTYSVTVIYNSGNCSIPSTAISMNSDPCPPSITSLQYTCSNSSASLSWSESGGSTGFYAEVVGGYTDSCNTTNTSCEFQNIPCGLNLQIKVRANGPQCNSGNSISNTFETVPCAPENVNAVLVCDHDSAEVTWTQTSLSVNYTVTATDQASVSYCHNVSTSCMLQNLQCGESYNITVTSHSALCTGLTSDVHTFKAGLCAPTSASVSSGCLSSTVNWSNVPGAEKVVATATNDNGQSYTCESSSSDSCDITDIPCGGNYSVSVVTVDRGCNSAPISVGELRAVVCPSTNLDGNIDCSTNAVNLTWNQSSVPGTKYSIKRELIGSNAASDVFNASKNTYTMNDLQCGETYNFSVAAIDGNCLGGYSTPVQISTAPCEPTTFTAHVDCGSNNVTFSWSEGQGASSHTVLVTGEHGHQASCTSNNTTCELKLHCGRFYSATLVASKDTCNTTKSGNLVIKSAPCLPENVRAVVNCSTNVMKVTWKEMPEPENYTAWAIATDGHNASCTSQSNHCSISDLECGQVYEVFVSASSINCTVIAGYDYKVQSAPCKPGNMTVELNCSANAVTVNWTQLNTNQNNTVTAKSDSSIFTCQTQDTSCNFSDLNCGTDYTFTAVAHTNVCISENSTMDKTTAPCAPTAVFAKLDCRTKEAVVTWDSIGLVESFSVQAQSSDGSSSSCTNTFTTCDLQELLCGQEYTVSVQAVYAGCTGAASNSTTFVTEPCVPVNLTTSYSVGGAQVTWAAAKGATSYSVEAVADHSAPIICNTSSSTQCALNGLLCGQTYNISVTAHNKACSLGVTSEPIQLTTEPCPPTNVRANMQCDQQTAIVSWDLSHNAVGYTAFLQNQNNHSTSCEANSTENSCEATGSLECGTVYTVYVVAKGNPNNSSPSNTTSVTAEPCQPSNINVTVNCETKAANASWQPSNGALSYVTVLKSLNHNVTCESNSSSCQFSHLHCGEVYSMCVTAVGGSCNTTSHMASNFYTEPCEPNGVNVSYTVGNVLVQWNTAKGATSYSVEALSGQGTPLECTNQSTQCTVSGLQCSKRYNVTVLAHNQACESQGVPSGTVQITTEPCPPSNIQANVECEQLEATISWDQSYFAVGYVAYVNNTQGISKYCDAASMDTSCVISGLDCDLVYNAWVIAKGAQYNSSKSTVISFISAPCSPQNISVQVNCSLDGGATVSWTANTGANFSVSSLVDGNPKTLCTTQQNSCVVSGLSCGQVYSLNLTATNNQCSVIAPTHPNLNTRPCPLTGVSTALDCASGNVTVKWQPSAGADDYNATLTSSSGLSDSCTSQSSSCAIAGLACGQNFSVSVTASNAQCSITSTGPLTQITAPCVPTIIGAEMDCATDTAVVSWTASSGAENYTVTGQSTTNSVSCVTNGLTCNLTNLACGTIYTIKGVARNSACSSAPSQAMVQDSAPCPPENVSAVIDCTSDYMAVSWSPSAQVQYYLVSVTAQNGGSNETRNTTDTTSTFSSVTCGNVFVVQVTSVRGSCHSQPSQNVSVTSKPCRPNAPVVEDSCGEVLVSWTVSPVADMYHVVAVGDNKHTHTCNTMFNNCTLSPLHCDQQYSVFVIASHRNCSSLASPNVTVYTGPCKPDNVSVTYDCLDSSALLTWNEKSNAVNYYASAVNDSGSMLYCYSKYPNCTFKGLQCGDIYNFTVLASNGTCNSSYSDPVSLGAVPCPPENLAVQLLPVQGDRQVLSLSWSESKCNSTDYLVRLNGNLMGDNDLRIDVSSSTTRTFFELPLPCSSNFTASVEARNSAGNSRPSSISGSTANKDTRRRRDLTDIGWNEFKMADH